MKPYDVVAELEKVVAKYSGAPYAVAVDSCTNALTLALRMELKNRKNKAVILPSRTYVGVAYAVLNAGGFCRFSNYNWEGCYILGTTKIIDSARRFTKDMYTRYPGMMHCLSAHWGKHLKIGRGGFILTDDAQKADELRVMRFDGRTAGVAPADDTFMLPGMHCYMLPEEAARGLMLMSYMPDYNKDLPWDNYADLSKFEIFKRPLCS